jgi:hypothetical protein
VQVRTGADNLSSFGRRKQRCFRGAKGNNPSNSIVRPLPTSQKPARGTTPMGSVSAGTLIRLLDEHATPRAILLLRAVVQSHLDGHGSPRAIERNADGPDLAGEIDAVALAGDYSRQADAQ